MTRGYTLPVWVTAAARAALGALRQDPFEPTPLLDLLAPGGPVPVPVSAAAALGEGRALGQAVCEPGEGLDLTRGLPVWVEARWEDAPGGKAAADGAGWLSIEAGEGVGRHTADGAPCLSGYARRLLETNLRPLVPADRRLRLRVVLPGGRALAARTSNAAFGVVEGLALIGTRAVPESSAGPDRLAEALAELDRRAARPDFDGDLVLVIGANGLDLAKRLGLAAGRLLRVGNWLGPVLVAAAERGVRRLLLFGYQGKLIKLAGGIFHTHHHLADGRAEVLTALAALEGVAGQRLAALNRADTVDTALRELAAVDPEAARRLRHRVATAVEVRSRSYLARHGQAGTEVGAVLFDRDRCLCGSGPVGRRLYGAFGGTP